MDPRLFVRFAQSTKHKHHFVDTLQGIKQCEFCEITQNECSHDEINTRQTKDDGIFKTICSCGFTRTEYCPHFSTYDDHDGGSGSNDDPYAFTIRCTDCDVALDN